MGRKNPIMATQPTPSWRTPSGNNIGKDLNKVQEEILFEAFRMFDKDGSGRIDNSEFRGVCRELGIVPTDSELQMMIEELDADNSGDIDMQEFANAISSKMVDPESDDHIRMAFAMFDSDGSGSLSHDEMYDVMLNLGENMAADKIDKLIKLADTDNDGEVNVKEFMAMVLDKPFYR